MGAGPELDEHARFEAFFPGSAADFLRLIGAWSIPFALLDAADAVLFWNRGAAKFYGIAEDDALGASWLALTGEAATASQVAVPGTRTRRYEARHRHRDGESLPVMVTRTELPGEDGTGGAFVLVTDLTESKALERRLARRVAQLSVLREIGECLQSEMSLERILRTILIGATASQGLRFNRAFLLLVDVRRGELRGRDAIGPANAEAAQRIWSRLSQHDRTLRGLVDEYDPIAEEGSSEVLDSARRLSAKLDDGTRFVVQALRAAGTTRVEHGCVVGSGEPASERVAEILGADAFVAVPLKAEGRPVGLLLADNAITKRAITDDDVDMLELLGLQAAHAIERARLTEELARQVGSLEDATREIRKNQERLVQSERLSAIGEMAARVAHEIRNPLVAIGGFARSLMAKAPRDLETQESLQIIVDEVRRLETIVRDVLDFSRPAPPRIGTVPLRRLVEEAVELLKFEIEQAGVVPHLIEAEGVPEAAADRDQLFQALVNLMRNAVHAMARGGDLTLRLAGVPPHGVEIAVTDTGSGMPPEVLAHVLEPFYTTKTNGSGLGLTIAAQIVRDHGGELKVESREGESTTVTMRLPAAEVGA